MAVGAPSKMALPWLALFILVVALQQERGSAFVTSTGLCQPMTNLGRTDAFVLSMGLRSFIGKRIRRQRDEGDDDSEDDDFVAPLEAIENSLPNEVVEPSTNSLYEQSMTNSGKVEQTPPMLPEPKQPVRMGENPTNKEINVFSLDRSESAQDRINRVKSGRMTDEEKAAFLSAALSTGGMRPPLRPPSSTAEQEARQSKASPFPEDPIYRSLAGGKTMESSAKFSNDLVDRVGLDMQKRKRDYLAQVTDPHRFDRFRTTRNNQNPSEGTAPISQPLPSDLGERLAAAANAQEVSRKAEEEKRRKQQEEEAARVAELNQCAREEQIQRQAQLAAEYERKKKREKSLSSQEEATLQRAQEERQRERMKAQEDFWARKLAEEKKAQQRQAEEDARQKEQQFMFDAPPARPLNPQPKPQLPPPDKVEEVPSPVPAPTPEIKAMPSPQAAKPISNPSAAKPAFNPDESNLVEPNVQSLERANGAPPPRPQPSYSSDDLNDVKNLNRAPTSTGNASYRKTKDTIVVDEQIRRLRALNSPLPSTPPQNNEVSRARTSPSFDPQRPVSASSVRDRSSAFDNLLRNNLNDVRNPEAKTRDLLNGFSGRTTKKEPQGTIQETRPTPTSSPPAPKPEPMRRAESTTTPRADNTFVSRMFGGKPKPTKEAAQTRESQPAPERKGPIRMQLPLGEDMDDEEEGIDSKANPGMSIAEAMKRTGEQGSGNQEERSKKWGVDMSKFT
mmetsp:Transcript_25824/g.71122  ORF Transcript_25824/g.71122 Transcript_25824/m.71122 type:complete len:732 (-) Transcript_25824:75-2270(-)